jgi:hypothetical protein
MPDSQEAVVTGLQISDAADNCGGIDVHQTTTRRHLPVGGEYSR